VFKFGLVFTVALLTISGCGDASRPKPAQADSYSSTSRKLVSEISQDAAADAQAGLASSTYEETAGSSDCTEDCSGHEAGFEYAKENELTDPDECDGNSQSFVEGCREYGDEIARRVEEFDEPSQ
jgi:hypothetical protein